MSRIEVRPIEFPRDTVEFCNTWRPVYKDDPLWVPPLMLDKKSFFNPAKNPYFNIAKVQGFIAYRDGEAVGTIAATVDSAVQEHEPGMGMFGFFEFVDDPDIARCLWRAATGWLREQGMTSVRGPYNLSPNHDFGLLIDGFDTPPMIANPHGATFYQRMYEDVLGLDKAMDWYAYWMDNDGPAPPQIARIAQRFMDRNPEYRVEMVDMKNFDAEIRKFREIYNDAWEDNWGHVYLSDDEFMFMAEGFKQVIDPRLAYFLYKGDEPVAASITLPDFNQLIKKANGKLFPFGWYHLLFGRKSIDAIRVFVLGVKKEYQRLPLGAPLYLKTWEEGSKLGIRGAEASLILENNHRMRGALEKLGGRIYKTYRTYEVSLGDDATE